MKWYIQIGIIAVLVFFTVFFTACQQKASEHEHSSHDHSEQSANQELYEEVMRIHDEVMPKMNDLHKAKTSMKTRLAMPGLAEVERQQIERQIARVDSAAEGMMIWMRQFNPIPDSAGEEEARAYLEQELEKVKEVKKDILDALKTVQ